MRRIGVASVVLLSASSLRAGSQAPVVSEDWLGQARAAIERAEYHFAAQPGGKVAAPNRAQGFRTAFSGDRIEVAPRTVESTPWTLGLRTTRWGRGDALQMLEAGWVRPEADRVRIERRELTESYLNDASGLEQLFDVPLAPDGDRDAGPLVIAMELSGDVIAAADRTGESVTFRGPTGIAVAHLGHLYVTDASGTELAARFRVTPGTVAIEIDDRDAVYPIHVDPLLTNPSWTTESNQASSFYGLRVAPAGDVNGDGFSDVLIGAHLYDNGQSNEGRVHLYLGSATGLSTTAARTFESNQADAQFGHAIATAGDLNDDGFDDFAIGAHLYDGGQTNEGAVFVYAGAASAASIALGPTLQTDQAEARFGSSLAYAGDVDGDGDSELVVGAPRWDGPLSNEGAIFVFHGDPSHFISTTTPWSSESDQADAFFGTSVAGGVDVNADGFSDVFAGAPGWNSFSLTDAGMFREYWGSATGLPAGGSGSSEGSGGSFGQTIAAVGDTNGDGFADVVVGAPFVTNTFTQEGRIALFRGTAAGGLNVAPTSNRYGGATGAQLGFAVGAAGDVNGDGFAEVVAGANGADPGGLSNAGEVRVWQGSAGGIPTAPAWAYAGTITNSGVGEAVFTAGDVNGDGYADLIVGAGGFDNGQTDEGRAYVFLGSGDGLVTTAATVQGDVSATENFGHSVASAGDVNADGFSDVIIGDPQYSPADSGAAFIFHGTASGVSTTFATMIVGPQFDAGYGDAVSGAGDFNGDGYDDVIVGAPFLDIDPGDRAGRVFVYFGGASGVNATADFTIDGLIDENLGRAVAGVGDVNGDGFGDIAVSGGIGDNTKLYYGSATSSHGVEFLDGEDVEAAGDVNGDGFSDVITNFSSGLSDQFSYIYYGGAPEMNSGADWTRSGTFESAVHPAGDVNGDGFDDVVWSVFGPLGGGSTLHLGSASGPPLTGTAVSFGTGLSRFAGDVDADGFSDLLVGGGGTLGAYLGSPSGYAATAAWSVPTANPVGAFAPAGDVNGDGFADVVVGDDTGTGGGSARIYLGGGGDALDYIPRLFRGDNTGPTAFLGSSGSTDRFRILSRGRSARGRAPIAQDHQVAPVGTTLTSTPIVRGGYFDTGATDATGASVSFNRTVSGLLPETSYKWRFQFRAKDPIFPRSRWFSMPGNGPEIKDVKTACVSSTWYRDVDGDGFGATAVSQVACAQPAGYVLPSGDCNDGNASIHPGRPEICDGVDNNCTGGIDDGFAPPGALSAVGALANTGNLAAFRWDALAGADRYDVVRGDLAALRSSGGDFKIATSACVQNDLTGTSFTETDPGSGQAQWYLVRGVNCTAAGSYDTGAPGQVGSRDAEIAASGDACP